MGSRKYRFISKEIIIRCQKLLWPALAVLMSFSCEPAVKQKPRLPNIIYIIADDLGYGDLGCYGQERFATPHIDQLAAKGMLFTQHYAGTTVCAPSRASLMTGLHTGHTYVRGNRSMNGGQFPLPEDAITLPGLLKQAGYVTGAFGKWGLGYPGSTGDPLNQGFDEFFGYNSQGIAHNYYPWELMHNQEKVLLRENDGTEQGSYAPALIHDKVLEFIERYQDSTFFLYIPTIIPHAELFAPKAYMDRFLKRSAVEQPFPVSQFAPETPYVGIDDPENPRYKVGGYGSQPYPRAAFAAMVTLLDDQVGEIMARLEELGLTENTLVIFTSDNGPHLEGGADPDYFNSNGPFQGYKRDLYEGGIRVPMIAKWPNHIAAGSRSDHISAFWDVLPTMGELAGVELPDGLDGISFVPALMGEEQAEHRYLYWEFHEQGGKQAVRMGNWKGIKLNVLKGEPSLALYDLSKDPMEQKDLSLQYPKVLDEISVIMKNARTEDPEWPFIPSN